MTTHTYVYGRHAVTEALRHTPHAIEKIFIAQGFDDAVILSLIKKTNVASSVFPQGKVPKEITKEIELTAVHQGVIALIALDKLIHQYKPFAESLNVTPDTCLVLLGEVQDPQNVGAVIRSAAAFGIAGVLIPEHNQAQLSGTVIKVSAGMAFRIPLVSIGNINNAVRDLKERGFWIYGLDGESKKSISDEKFDAPTLFILGNEARGIRPKTLELCDILVSIPMNPHCESLNAATSASVALYEWSTEHHNALK